jgi:hypothetical protein
VLTLDWDHPVYVAPERHDGPTVAPAVRRALPADQALEFLADKDPRPLLVLRECVNCNGTDEALLSREKVDNERTFILSRWFHCVRLPVDVLEENHPLHALFVGEDAPHMFMCAADGSSMMPLEAERSRVELWSSMSSVLRTTYAGDPEKLVRKIESTLDDIDLADVRISTAEQRIDELLETEGPSSPKMKKAQQEFENARKQRDGLLQGIDKATAELELVTARKK